MTQSYFNAFDITFLFFLFLLLSVYSFSSHICFFYSQDTTFLYLLFFLFPRYNFPCIRLFLLFSRYKICSQFCILLVSFIRLVLLFSINVLFFSCVFMLDSTNTILSLNCVHSFQFISYHVILFQLISVHIIPFHCIWFQFMFLDSTYDVAVPRGAHIITLAPPWTHGRLRQELRFNSTKKINIKMNIFRTCGTRRSYRPTSEYNRLLGISYHFIEFHSISFHCWNVIQFLIIDLRLFLLSNDTCPKPPLIKELAKHMEIYMMLRSHVSRKMIMLAPPWRMGALTGSQAQSWSLAKAQHTLKRCSLGDFRRRCGSGMRCSQPKPMVAESPLIKNVADTVAVRNDDTVLSQDCIIRNMICPGLSFSYSLSLGLSLCPKKHFHTQGQ